MFSSLCCLRHTTEAATKVKQPHIAFFNARRKNVSHRRRVRYNSTAATFRSSGREVYVDEGEADENDAAEQAAPIYPRKRPVADPEPLRRHLESLFPPLDFPPILAKRMLTHISAMEAWEGHNSRLSFVGRRVLQSYLLLFLHSIPRSPGKEIDYDLIAYRTLFTNLLGEHVGSKWKLSRHMVWTPSVSPDRRKNPRSPHEIGLYKVQGTTVEGIMGGLFHQFGGSVTHRVFHTRLLPHILLPGSPQGLPDYLHEAALNISEKMGGADCLLASTKKFNTESISRISESSETDIKLPS